MELKAMRTIITAVLLAALTIAGLGCGGGEEAQPAPSLVVVAPLRATGDYGRAGHRADYPKP
jgi:hypothetical protein